MTLHTTTIHVPGDEGPVHSVALCDMTASACAAEQGQRLIVVDSVASVGLRMKDDAAPVVIPDREWTRKLLATITGQDFPESKEPLGFARPGELCSVEFRDADGKPLRGVTVFAAWNLSVTTDTTTEDARSLGHVTFPRMPQCPAASISFPERVKVSADFIGTERSAIQRHLVDPAYPRAEIVQ